jgi:hypothetical protein
MGWSVRVEARIDAQFAMELQRYIGPIHSTFG